MSDFDPGDDWAFVEDGFVEGGTLVVFVGEDAGVDLVANVCGEVAEDRSHDLKGSSMIETDVVRVGSPYNGVFQGKLSFSQVD